LKNAAGQRCSKKKSEGIEENDVGKAETKGGGAVSSEAGSASSLKRARKGA